MSSAATQISATARPSCSAEPPRTKNPRESFAVSLIPCTSENTYCVVDWTERRVSIQTGKIRYNFPFARCCITSVWTERALKLPHYLVRRAVISVQGFTLWQFTLSPDTPANEETAVLRLADELGYSHSRSLNGGYAESRKEIIHRSNVGRSPTFLQKLFRSVPCFKSSGTADIMAVYENSLTSRLISTTPTVDGRSPGVMLPTFSSKSLFSFCLGSDCYRSLLSDEVFGLTSPSRTASEIFGEQVFWRDEPILLSVVFCFRHGQQHEDYGHVGHADPTLTELGRLQSIRVAELFFRLTNGFTNTQTIWSSRLNRCAESADIVKMFAKRYGTHKKEIQRVYHQLLSEFTFPYPYKIDAVGTAREEIEGELEEDARALNESRSLFSAGLRGQGLLARAVNDYFNPVTLCQDGRYTNTKDSPLLWAHRFPALPKTPLKIAGFYLGTPPALMSPSETEGIRFVYSGHGNTIRHQVFEELGFPKHFWRHAQIPHGSVFITGIHHSGRPAMIVADAGYVVSPPSCIGTHPCLPLTFTPLIEGEELPRRGLSFRERLTTDNTVSLLREDEWFARYADLNIRYNAPPEIPALEKHVCMLRTGHNRVSYSRDAGLTDIGVDQLNQAANWLGTFFTSSTTFRRPKKWCTAGLTSQWSSVDLSLKESIMTTRRVLSQHLGKDYYSPGLLDSDDELYPEYLFGPARENDVLYVVLADDYHLLKYFGACFGICPQALQYLYWPHAAFIVVTVSELGWPELRVFGTVSHMHPDHITFTPPTVVDSNYSQAVTSNTNLMIKPANLAQTSIATPYVHDIGVPSTDTRKEEDMDGTLNLNSSLSSAEVELPYKKPTTPASVGFLDPQAEEGGSSQLSSLS